MAKSESGNFATAHENLAIGILLSIFGGFLDSYSYLLKGGVFANAQTGNLVLLFIALVEGKAGGVLKYSIPILMFAAGILASETLKNREALNARNRRIKTVLMAEGVVIVLIAFAGKRFSDFAIDCVISFLAAVQVSSFDRIDGNPIATTMITGNLRSSMVSMNKFLRTRDAAHLGTFGKYAAVIVGFGLGVAIGAVLGGCFGDYSILACEFFLFGAYLVLKREERGSRG